MPTPLRHRMRLARRGVGYVVAIVLVCMAVTLGVASQLLPLVDRHPDRVAAWLSVRAGRPVAFDHVETSWTRRGPLLRLDGLRIGEGGGVRIGQAEVLVSMYAGLLPGHSFTELRLRGLSLTLQRADDGVWSVRGLPGQQGDSDPLANLEGLGELQVIGGRLAIVAPSLGWNAQLPSIDLRLRVDGDRVRAGTRIRARNDGEPLRAAIDFDRRRGDGRAYLRAEPADLADWSPLLRYAGVRVDGGRGRSETWLNLHGHRVVMATSRLQLRQVALSGEPQETGNARPQAAFEQVEGLLRWRLRSGGWRFDAPLLRVGARTQPQKLDGLLLAGGDQYAMRAARLEAAPLLSVLALSDRIDPGLRDWLTRARPELRVSNLALSGRRGGAMRAQGHLDGVRFAAAGHAPGLDGLAGDFFGDGEGFALTLDHEAALRFDWPSGFGVAHDVKLDGRIAGWREGEGWRVGTPSLRIDGGDYAASVRGGLWFQNDGTRPWIDLAADLDPAPVPVAKKFWVRSKMSKAALDWLDTALQGGTVRDGHAIASGDLDDWPFEHDNGRFEATGRIVGGQIRFSEEWPAVDRLDADVAFIANGFSLRGRGALAGVEVGKLEAGIADFGESNLTVKAEGAAGADKLLAMLRQSPLQKEHGDTLANLEASGPARVGFDLLQPLHHGNAAAKRMRGTVELQGVKLADKRFDLAFDGVRGAASYDDHGFDADKLRVMHAGQPGALSLRAGGGVRDPNQVFEAEMTASLAATELLDRAPEMAWLKPYVEGRSQWTVGVAIPKGSGANAAPTRLRLRSDLTGTALKLPAPLDKPAGQALATTISAPLPLGSGMIDVAFGKRLALRARSSGKQTGVRVALGSDSVDGAPPASGLVAIGRTPTLDAMDWIALTSRGSGENDLPLRHIDIAADHLRLLGSDFPATRMQLAPAGSAVAVTLEGSALAGAVMVPKAQGAAVVGRLSRLYWRAAAPGANGANAATSAATPADEVDPASVPPLTLDVDDLRFADAQLGEAKLRTQPVAGGLRIDQLQLRAPKQKIDISGDWLGRGAAARTRLNAGVDSGDFGGLLDDLGMKGRMRGGEGRVTLDAAWPGSPAAFALANVQGGMKASIRNGQLLEVDPGAGRVLGLLSIAQLPRRLMFDFRDFFDKGFGFNRIEGSVAIGGGSARTDDMLIDGPAAEIKIRGDTDLRAQRFDQTIDVRPKSGNLLTVVGAVAGGPIGAAVGAAANAVLGKPLGGVGAKTYRVTGPWKEPKVEVIDREQPRADNVPSGSGGP